MRSFIFATAATAMFLTPVLAMAGTGIGKGGEPPPQTMPVTHNPCAQGETYDAEHGLCIRQDGTIYRPR